METTRVQGLKGNIFVLNLGNTEEMENMTVLQLKEKVKEKEGVPVNKQRLIFNGRLMEDSDLVSDHKVQHGGIIQLAVRVRGGGATRRSLENLADFLDPQASKP